MCTSVSPTGFWETMGGGPCTSKSGGMFLQKIKVKCVHLAIQVLRLVPRVAVVGNVDAGKSTLLGVLTHGELDNGRGFARQKLFRHKHEMESGRTSSVGNDILGFDQEGQVGFCY